MHNAQYSLLSTHASIGAPMYVQGETPKKASKLTLDSRALLMPTPTLPSPPPNPHRDKGDKHRGKQAAAAAAAAAAVTKRLAATPTVMPSEERWRRATSARGGISPPWRTSGRGSPHPRRRRRRRLGHRLLPPPEAAQVPHQLVWPWERPLKRRCARKERHMLGMWPFVCAEALCVCTGWILCKGCM